MWMRQSFLNLFQLFFPELCAGCGQALISQEELICTTCIYQLPATHFHLDPENRLARQLWGRFPFEQASAFVHFQKGSIVQNLMHQLKYRQCPELGRKMGELYAQHLLKTGNWTLPDLIIPVPLHPQKQKLRGYNQSEAIAQGMSQQLAVPSHSANLYRILHTPTQTSKTRFARYENLIGAFHVKDPSALRQQHILLIDDVMTTGATLEACAMELLKIEGTRLSISALAYAE